MTTLLTQQQTDALRSIGDGALVLFAMSMVDSNYPGRITKPTELLPYLYPTYKDVRKITTQLNALSASGRLAQNGGGYVLLEGGRALLLEMSGNALPEVVSEPLAQSPALAAGTVIEAQAEEIEELSGMKGEISARAMRAYEMTLKKEEEENLILRETDSSSSKTAQNARSADPVADTPDPDADPVSTSTDTLEIAPGVTTERILLATSTLEGFGEDGVFLHGLDLASIHPREALGWIAQAYHQRERLGSPSGLVYSRLRNDEQPKARTKYREGWESFLPEDYLRAIGWLSLTCECGEQFDSLVSFEAHKTMLMTCEYGCGARFHSRQALDEHHTTHEAKADTFTVLADTDRGARAWKMVRDGLALDLPKASFDTWVKDAQPVSFEENTLMIVVRNAYAADWLSSRLGDKVRAMLKTFTHEDIQVDFVVGTVEGAENG